MNVLKENLFLAAVAAAVLSFAGCGGPSDRPELGTVTGTITLDGKPLSGIAVVFTPENGRPARGRTDAEGKYELTYIRDTKGTKVGLNRVEVAPNEEGDDGSEAQVDDSSAAKPKAKSAKLRIPARYNTKTELEADVKPGENTFNFDLKST